MNTGVVFLPHKLGSYNAHYVLFYSTLGGCLLVFRTYYYLLVPAVDDATMLLTTF